jgi:hypothetical protein
MKTIFSVENMALAGLRIRIQGHSEISCSDDQGCEAEMFVYFYDFWDLSALTTQHPARGVWGTEYSNVIHFSESNRMNVWIESDKNLNFESEFRLFFSLSAFRRYKYWYLNIRMTGLNAYFLKLKIQIDPLFSGFR